jgi:hypothetical protein
MRKLTMLIRIQLLLVLYLFALAAYGQQESNSIQSSIEQKQFTFLAQSVTPAKGGTRQLSPGYTLIVKGDTLICHLPYFGRVYQPSFGTNDAGLDFTSVQFDYQTKVRKKGGWDVKIKTKDLSNQRQLSLTIFQNGTASVNVICSDRESISFNGALDNKQK